MNYKVIKGEVGGNGNKIFKEGDIVTDENFPRGNAESLVKMGVLEVVKTAPKAEPKTEPATEKPVKSKGGKSKKVEETDEI